MKEKLYEAFAGLGNSILTSAPKVAIGVLLAVLGFIAAKIVELALRVLLTRIHFDAAISRLGIDRALHRIGFRQKLSLALSKLTYILVLLLLAKTFSDALGLVAISDAIGAFFSYLPNIVAALLLLLLGSTLGQAAGEMVSRAAESSGIDFAPALGKMVTSLIVFIVAMMAIGQLKIDTEMVRIVTCFVLGAGALAFGLAFGLGTRDIVRNLVVGFYTRRVLEIGKPLEIAGQVGVLSAVTATHTVLTNGEQAVILSNATFLEQTTRQ